MTETVLSVYGYNEKLLALLAIVTGVWTLVFAPVQADGLALLQQLVPLWLWATTILICGLLLVLVRAPHLRRVLHAALFLAWLLVSVSLAKANPTSILIVTYGVIAFLHAGKFWRLSDYHR